MPRPPKAATIPPDSTAVKKAIAKSGGGVDSGMLLNNLIECWGGPAAFAKDIFAEFQTGKAGGMTRQKILEMVSRLTIVVTNQQIARPRRPEDMTDDELVGVAQTLLERLGHERAPTVPEAPPGPTSQG